MKDRTEELYKLAGHIIKKMNLNTIPDFYSFEDIIQDLVMTANDSLSLFDENKSNFSTYVCRVMQNRILAIQRTYEADKRKGETKTKNFSKISAKDELDNNLNIADFGKNVFGSSKNYNVILEKVKPYIDPFLLEVFYSNGIISLAKIKKVSQQALRERYKRALKRTQNNLINVGLYDYYKEVLLSKENS